MAKTNITLAFETAIGGGSLTLFDGDSVLDEWVGKSEVSRSEELIEAVSAILKRNNMEPRDLTELFVSRGPGSLTGVRIGLATAIGLKNGLNIKCFGISIFDAFYHKWGNSRFDTVAAVSFGKHEVCFQYFQHSRPFQHTNRHFDIKRNQNFNQEINTSGAKSVTENDLIKITSFKVTSLENFVRFFNLAAKKADKENPAEDFKMRIITNQKLYNAINLHSQNNSEIAEVINGGQNLSVYIGHLGLNNFNDKASDNLEPIYIN